MNRNKVLGDLGLARRANKLILGEIAAWELMKKGKAILAFLASDAGKNTSKRLVDKSTTYQVRLIHDFTAVELEQAVGLANIKVIALADAQFAQLLIQAIDE